MVRSAEELADLFTADADMLPGTWPGSYNIAPTQAVPVVVARPPQAGETTGLPQRQLRAMRWGLVPQWGRDDFAAKMINARVETVATKPSFRAALCSRRVIVPADGYYEWTPMATAAGAIKQPFYLQPTRGDMLAMAGLYELYAAPQHPQSIGGYRWTFTIITTEATADIAHLHPRMPLLLAPHQWEQWLDPTRSDVHDLLESAIDAPPEQLAASAVSRLVSQVRNNGPELIEPISGPGEHRRAHL